MRVTILGGQGHIGSLIRQTLEQEPRVRVAVASRRSGFDLQRADCLSSLPSGILINCTDTYRISPGPLYRAALRQPVVLLETSADTGAYLAMDAALADLPASARRGTLVPGVGVFPGLSNLLAAEVCQDAEPGGELRLELGWSLISGAGAGTCEVMVQALRQPRRFLRDGQLHTAAPLGAVERLALPDRPWGLELGLPEAVLLPRSLPIASCRCFAAVRPALPGPLLRLARGLAAARVFALPLAGPALRLVFRGLRTGLWRHRSTALRMRAQLGSRSGTLICEDAFASAGAVVTAAVSAILDAEPRPGIAPLETWFALRELDVRARALSLDAWPRREPAAG